MVKKYNQVGSLNFLNSKLKYGGAIQFGSVPELLEFNNEFAELWQRTLRRNRFILEQKFDQIKRDEVILVNQCSKLKRKFSLTLSLVHLWKQLQLGILLIQLLLKLKKIKKQRHRLEFEFDDVLTKESNKDLTREIKTNQILEEYKSFVIGAAGEYEVEEALTQLPDHYHLLNDLNLRFSKALFFRKTGEYIKSAQIDHLVVGPSGVFVIESKKWGFQTLNNSSLSDPILQVQRASYAVYKFLHPRRSNAFWGLFFKPSKITTRSILVMVNQNMNTYQNHVKVLAPSQLCNYIEYFKWTLTFDEVDEVVSKLKL